MKKIISVLLLLLVLGGSAYAETIDVQFNSVNLVANNKPIEVPNILYNGTTYVPLRAVSETLNMNVNWNDKTRTASVTQPSQTETEAKLSDVSNALKAYKDAVYAKNCTSVLRDNLYGMYNNYLRIEDIYDNYVAYPNYQGIHIEMDFFEYTESVNIVLDEEVVANHSLKTACEITGYSYESVASLLDYANKAAYYFNSATEELELYRDNLNPYNLSQTGTYLATGRNYFSEIMDVIVEMDNTLRDYVLGYEF